MKEQKELSPVPDYILNLLSKHALGNLRRSDQQVLEQWMTQHPDKLNECNEFRDRVKKLYWIYLSENTKEPSDVINNISLKRTSGFIQTRRLYNLLIYAATIMVLAGFAWYFIHLVSIKKAINHHSEIIVFERHNKAVLVLSDGSSLVLDSPESSDMPNEEGVHITNLPGKILQYKQQEVVDNKQPMNRLIVPAGARYELQLADGTHVWMNAKSELEYPVAFASSQRRVILSGEAYFDVQSDVSSPFIIETNGYEIVVTGTTFNVSAYAEDGYIQTTLVSGTLEVNSREGVAHKLNPGQMAVIHHKSQEVEIEFVDTRLFTSWREGVLHFNKISLRELATRLERWYDVQIIFENKKAADFIFSGAMENSRDINFLLNLIGRAANVEFETEEKQIIVK